MAFLHSFGTVALVILYGALAGPNVPYRLFAGCLRNLMLRTNMVYNFCGLTTLAIPPNEEAFSRAVEFINANLALGKLKPAIAKTFPLEAIEEAHRYMESTNSWRLDSRTGVPLASKSATKPRLLADHCRNTTRLPSKVMLGLLATSPNQSVSHLGLSTNSPRSRSTLVIR
jgi:zinc-binding alcohol dehydrogenase family protein